MLIKEVIKCKSDGKLVAMSRERVQDQIAECMRSKDGDLNLPMATICFVQSQQPGKSRLYPQRNCTGKDRSGEKHMSKTQSLKSKNYM